MQAINDGKQGDFEIVYTSTALSRNENDIGNSYVELSLSDQHFGSMWTENRLWTQKW